MPGKPFQSKLEPFYGFIRECRAKRWSYLRIAAAITQDHGMSVSANAVFSFVKVRAKGRKLYTLPGRPESGSFRSEQNPASSGNGDMARLAASFFTPTDEAPKQSPQKTNHEKRPYRLDF